MINRREFLGMAVGAGASLALTPELLRALQLSSTQLIQRAIPSTGEKLPVIGLHFGKPVPPDHAALKEVLEALVDNGARFLDTVHGNGQAEEVTATLANELGIQNKVFWSSRGSPPARRSPARPPRERRSRGRWRGSRCPASAWSWSMPSPIRRTSPS